MKKIIILTLSILAQFSFATEKSVELDKLIKAQGFKKDSLGILIAKNGKEVFTLNSDKKMIPASLTKIFTAGAILNTMSLNHKFKTLLLSSGKVQDGVLKGNLCLKGGGDPSFVSEKMWFLVNELSRNEISKIEGDIEIDATFFDSESFDKGRDKTRVDRAYDAPISAISFNWNSVNIFVRPGEKLGLSSKVFVDPKNDYIELKNESKTVREDQNSSIVVSRDFVDGKDRVVVKGNIALGSKELVFYKSITDPVLWTGNHLKQFLLEKKISVSGKIMAGRCSDDSRELAKVESKNLVEMTADMLKFSNNFVAEMLVKNLSNYSDTSMPGSMEKGILEVKKYINAIGIKESDFTLVNVSGLTRENKFSANQIFICLNSLSNNFAIFPEFLSGLPIAGVDGTLKSRFKDQDNFVVRAKTGYLDGIIGLAGFIYQPNKAPYTFVFMFNGGFEKGLTARQLFDEIIKRVVKWD